MGTTTQKFCKPTIESRLAIGFPKSKSEWQDSQAVFSEHALTILGHPVMEDWEHPYMKELANIACSNQGKILEVGFGMGISASYIQSLSISEHWIIEANAEVFERLIEFALTAQNPVHPFLGFWQDVVKDLPEDYFSGILFDTYPMSEGELHCNHYDFFPLAYRLLKSDGVFTYYSDESLDYSPEHYARLQDAGFEKIGKQICQVTPPPNCQYWQYNTLLVPIVRK